MPSDDARLAEFLKNAGLPTNPEETPHGGKSVTRITRSETWEIERDFKPRDSPKSRFWIKAIGAVGRAIARIVKPFAK